MKVAILGTEGTGKTVLTGVMAWGFRHERLGIRLIPLSAETAQWIASLWGNFMAKGEWPPTNPDGQLRELKWELQVEASPNSELRVLDFSGQDFRGVFGFHETGIDHPESMPDIKRKLVEYMEEAHVLAFLVNLKDFIGESEVERREESQWALKRALDWAKDDARRKQCAVIFTQIDQFEEVRAQCGGWREVAERYIPYVYGAHLRLGEIPLHAVSAVGNTKVIFGADREPRRVPDGKWNCQGLPELLKWIGNATADVASRPVIAEANGQPVSVPPRLPKSPGAPQTTFLDWLLKAGVIAVLCVFAITVLIVIMAIVASSTSH